MNFCTLMQKSYFCHQMNKKLPSYLLGKYQLIGSGTFSVLFAIIFLNIYIPFSDTAWFGLGQSDMFSGTLIFVFVSILTLIISRTLMYRSKRLFEMTLLDYVLWCIGEIVIIGAFYTKKNNLAKLDAAERQIAVQRDHGRNGRKRAGDIRQVASLWYNCARSPVYNLRNVPVHH